MIRNKPLGYIRERERSQRVIARDRNYQSVLKSQAEINQKINQEASRLKEISPEQYETEYNKLPQEIKQYFYSPEELKNTNEYKQYIQERQKYEQIPYYQESLKLSKRIAEKKALLDSYNQEIEKWGRIEQTAIDKDTRERANIEANNQRKLMIPIANEYDKLNREYSILQNSGSLDEYSARLSYYNRQAQAQETGKSYAKAYQDKGSNVYKYEINKEAEKRDDFINNLKKKYPNSRIEFNEDKGEATIYPKQDYSAIVTDIPAEQQNAINSKVYQERAIVNPKVDKFMNKFVGERGDESQKTWDNLGYIDYYSKEYLPRFIEQIPSIAKDIVLDTTKGGLQVGFYVGDYIYEKVTGKKAKKNDKFMEWSNYNRDVPIYSSPEVQAWALTTAFAGAGALGSTAGKVGTIGKYATKYGTRGLGAYQLYNTIQNPTDRNIVMLGAITLPETTKIVRNVYARTGSVYVPPEEIFSKEVLEKGKTFPTSRNVPEMLSKFDKGKEIEYITPEKAYKKIEFRDMPRLAGEKATIWKDTSMNKLTRFGKGWEAKYNNIIENIKRLPKNIKELPNAIKQDITELKANSVKRIGNIKQIIKNTHNEIIKNEYESQLRLEQNKLNTLENLKSLPYRTKEGLLNIPRGVKEDVLRWKDTSADKLAKWKKEISKVPFELKENLMNIPKGFKTDVINRINDLKIKIKETNNEILRSEYENQLRLEQNNLNMIENIKSLPYRTTERLLDIPRGVRKDVLTLRENTIRKIDDLREKIIKANDEVMKNEYENQLRLEQNNLNIIENVKSLPYRVSGEVKYLTSNYKNKLIELKSKENLEIQKAIERYNGNPIKIRDEIKRISLDYSIKALDELAKVKKSIQESGIKYETAESKLARRNAELGISGETREITRVSHATKNTPKREDTLGGSKKKTSEDSGLYVSPKGEGSPYFLDTSGIKPNIPTEYTLNPFKNIGITPQMWDIKVKGIERLPIGVRNKAIEIYKKDGRANAFNYINNWYSKQIGKGKGYIPLSSEMGKMETQAVISEGTKISQIVEGSIINKVKGYKYYTIYDGEVIPIKKFEIEMGKKMDIKEYTKVKDELAEMKKQNELYSKVKNKQYLPTYNYLKDSSISVVKNKSEIYSPESSYNPRQSEITGKYEYYGNIYPTDYTGSLKEGASSIGRTPKEYPPYNPITNVPVRFPEKTKRRFPIPMKTRRRVTGFQPIMYDESGTTILGDTFATMDDAIREGAIGVDETGLNQFKIISKQVNPSDIKAGRKINVVYKFRQRNGVYYEKSQYTKDRSREKGFNWVSLMKDAGKGDYY